MTQLERLQLKLHQADPVDFDESDLNWLLTHLGDPDSYLRDTLTYSLFERGFMAHGFTQAQKSEVASRLEVVNGLWSGIDEAQNSFVFLRSFTALVGALILSTDADQPFLSVNSRQTWIGWALKYLTLEQDRRGFVPENGWAHAIAHGSDFLEAAIRHPRFPEASLPQAMQVVEQVLQDTVTPFIDDEEERLAVVLQAITSHQGGIQLVSQGLMTCGDAFWSNYQQTSSDVIGYYRVSTLKRVCEALYFLEPSMSTATKREIDRYFQGMGYVANRRDE
jgi:hypothetical protein